MASGLAEDPARSCSLVVAGVHSLCTEQRAALFYAAAHTGVIYDYATRTQLLLQVSDGTDGLR